MYRFLPSALSALTVLSLAGAAQAAPVLFVVTDRNHVAEQLSYGAGPVTAGGATGLSTDVGGLLHDTWYSRGVDSSSKVYYDITWQFSSVKTVAQRFQDAVDTGETVTWTVTSPFFSLGPTVFTGTWRFSSTAGAVGARFAGTGTHFSSDDGAWGAGNGIVNGSGGGARAGMSWGFANRDGADVFSGGGFGTILVFNGVDQGSIPAGFQNLVFVDDALSGAPELNAASAGTPLTALFCLMAIVSGRRRLLTV